MNSVDAHERKNRTGLRIVDLAADVTGRILVVDDDARNRKLLRDLLTYHGHEVVEAVDGQTAIDQAMKTQPDVVLLDVLMPDMTGFEVCSAMRATEALAATPILIITALADRDHRLKAIEHGANDVLTKPLDNRDAILRVRNAVRMKKLYDQLQQTVQHLRETEQLHDRLMRWIVHDMKAPIGGIQGYLELLLMDAADRLTPEQANFVREALQSTKRLINMANTLLDVARLEENRFPVKVEDVEAGAILKQVHEELGGIAAEKSAVITLPEGEAWVRADADVLRRVLTNLVDNALRVVRTGEGRIQIGMETQADKVRITVTDNGPGIDPNLHSRLFEKFGMVDMDMHKKPYSTGLGLHFSKLALEAMGGNIGVISDVGKGSTFWLTLPIGQKPSPKENATNDGADNTSSTGR